MAGRYDLKIRQGASLSLPLSWAYTGIDFTGATARAKIVSAFPLGTILATLTCPVTSAALSSITVTVSMTATETAALSTTSTKRQAKLGEWDIEIVLGDGRVLAMLEGAVWLTQESTR
ncbi:MAG: hypothetical protein H0W72_05360 [Planctomycetes bacterium]|nr:hypothetical protein [Planctomycetota bacterium]